MAKKKKVAPVQETEWAFPRTYNSHGHNGINMRDYFAAKALQGLLASRTENRSMRFNPSDDAKYCFRIADAMVQYRAFKEEEMEESISDESDD
jgi:hypothetical protein